MGARVWATGYIGRRPGALVLKFRRDNELPLSKERFGAAMIAAKQALGLDGCELKVPGTSEWAIPCEGDVREGDILIVLARAFDVQGARLHLDLRFEHAAT